MTDKERDVAKLAESVKDSMRLNKLFDALEGKPADDLELPKFLDRRKPKPKKAS